MCCMVCQSLSVRWLQQICSLQRLSILPATKLTLVRWRCLSSSPTSRALWSHGCQNECYLVFLASQQDRRPKQGVKREGDSVVVHFFTSAASRKHGPHFLHVSSPQIGGMLRCSWLSRYAAFLQTASAGKSFRCRLCSLPCLLPQCTGWSGYPPMGGFVTHYCRTALFLFHVFLRVREDSADVRVLSI